MEPENRFAFNQEQSDKLNQKPIYKQFKDWLKKNGVLLDPAIVYPAYFGPSKKGVVGVATNKLIPGGQAIISVPYDLIITVPKVKEDPQLKKIIEENPNIFKFNDQSAFFILTLFMCRQIIKGKNSFYAPYFAIADDISLVNWTHFDMLAIQNPDVIRNMRNQLEEMEESFMSFLAIFRRYSNIFPENLNNTQYKQTYEKAFNFICTRAFGWSLPSISLIPMADSLNHNNQYVTHMLIDVKLQKSPHEFYTVKSNKFNLSLLQSVHPQIPKTQPSLRKKRKVDKFVQKHKQILQGDKKKDSQGYILWQQYKAGVRNFRQLHFYDESCQQDNDTDEQTIQKFQFKYEKFRFYEKYETLGINQKNKAASLSRYWNLFLQPTFKEQSSQSSEEQKKQKKQFKHLNDIKEKFIAQSKQSEGSSLVSSSSSSDSDDEQFKWMAGNPDSHDHKSTYFIMATRKPIKKNEEVYNFYGRRSNKFLLTGYNFVLEENKYDSFSFRINIDDWKTANKPFQTKIPISKIINKSAKMDVYFTKQIRLKKQRICIELINHCRALLIGWSDLKLEGEKKVRVTIPFSLEFEKKVLNLASQFIKTLQKDFMTTIEEDEQLLEKAQKSEAQSAIQIRINYKRILEQQLQFIGECLQSLKKWKGGRLNIENQKQMRSFGRIKEYICSLQRAKI